MAEILPKDCWRQILSKLNGGSELEPISLVCKDFLSISDSLRRKLTFLVTDSSINVDILSRLLERFPRLKEIHLIRDYIVSKNNSAAIDYAILQISHSSLKSFTSLHVLCRCSCESSDRFFFESFAQLGCASPSKNLKVLTLSVCKMDDRILQQVGDCFPFLEELYINNPCSYSSLLISDNGVGLLTSKLKYLKKTFLLGFISDKSLVALPSNCVSLRVLNVSGHTKISEDGIGYFIRHCPKIVSLSLPSENHNVSLPEVSSYTFESSIAYAKELQHLDIQGFIASDDSLSAITEAKLPLKSFSFNAQCCTVSGLSSFLRAHHSSLSSLAIRTARFLTDDSLRNLTFYLQKVSSIALHNCYGLTNSSFVILVKSCPSIRMIEMTITSLGKGHFETELYKNEKFQHLILNYNSHLNDETLEKIARLCPNLQHLDLKGCSQVTNKGIINFSKMCRQLWIISLLCHCKGLFKEESETLRLNVKELSITYSNIGDDDLVTIGKICRNLQKLDLEGCCNITTSGVMEIVMNCKRLKVINLQRCSEITSDILSRIFVSRPLLRISL